MLQKMKRIISRENPFFLSLLKLSKSTRERNTEKKAVLDGLHLIEAYISNIGLPEVIVVQDSSITHGEIATFLEHNSAPVVILADSLFNALSPVKTPTGILAVISVPKIESKSNHDRPCVILENIQDPGNLGSILRSAAGAGIKDVYLSPQCADIWSPKVLRAAMGAHFQLELQVVKDLHQVIRNYEGRVVATVAKNGKSIFDADLTGSIAIIFGNEGSGISETLLELANEKITIPTVGKTESLNVAAAAAIYFFEILRQHTKS